MQRMSAGEVHVHAGRRHHRNGKALSQFNQRLHSSRLRPHTLGDNQRRLRIRKGLSGLLDALGGWIAQRVHLVPTRRRIGKFRLLLDQDLTR